MIDPQEIPEFTGDLEQLEKDYGSLKKDAGNIRSTGADVHSQFQGLSAYYHAPEAETLFASTKPVSDRSDTFATDLETVSSALSGYATEIRPLVAKLKQLKTEATEFVASVKGDDDWEYDGDKVDKHNRIRDDITAAVAAFWAAERTCHNEITALWHGTQMIAGDGSDKKNQYGYNASDLKDAKLPWGDPVEEKHHWYEVGHWVKSFVWDGLIVDGVWGTIKGLGTLVGFGGWDAMGQAWKGLAQLATGLTLSMMPGAQLAFWALPDKALPSWFCESRNTMKQTGKALLAWDEWGKNPARAAGAVTFNVLTTVFTGGEGAAAAGAGKAGAVAKAVSLAGKAGKIIDPMTYVMKGAGAGLSKVGDIAKNLKGVGKIDIPTLPDGSVHLPDGRLLEPNGNLLDHAGNVETTPIPKEAAPGLPAHWTVPAPETAPVGVSHAVGNGAHGALPHVGNGIHGGIPKSVGDGVHGGIPHSAGNAVHGGTPHVPGNGIHGGIPKSAGNGIHGGIPKSVGDGVHGGVPHSAGNAVHGGAPHVPGNGIHGGIPKPVGDGVHGGVPHAPGNAVHGGVPHVPGSGVHGGVPHGTGDAVSAGGHAGTTPSAWYHETPTAPAHEVPHTTPHDAPPATPHTGGHDTPGTGGHPDHGAGHDGTGHDAGHAHDAGNVGDHGGLGHDAADIAGHDGVDAATPGHAGSELPGHGGAGDTFEYKPHVSADEFDDLSVEEKHRVATAELSEGTLPFADSKAAIEYGQDYWNDYVDNLDPSARQALNDYSGDYFPSYKDINGYLRGSHGFTSRPEVLHDIAEMDRVLSSRAVPDTIMVVRGTDLGYLNLRSPMDMLGQTFPDLGYTSTSLGDHPVGAFKDKEAVMHLRLPEGTPALWLEKVSNYGAEERELLLARGTDYRVTRVFMDNGKIHVYGEVLPRS
ncbi:ADP-ribosyltransferase [Streptomyces sp. NBC_01518]|uniref:ADP-ribosyltransferase n=1 Tax=Streptomyces sp. NBC_01518 TaxID=2903891 RepID=UPI003867A07A